METLKKINTKPFLLINILIFAGLTLWWVFLNYFSLTATDEDKQLFAATYQILALLGGVVGLVLAHSWGGFQSVFGRALTFFAIGLFLQSFGQSVYSYFIYFSQVDIPYPSLGDIGFFGSVIFYILGVISLLRVTGFRMQWRSFSGKMQAVFIPALLLIVSYLFFLKDYEFDWSNGLAVFLDFGYPLGQAIYVSIAILTLMLAGSTLGGMMRRPILFLIFALIVQYFADFMFLYQAHQGTWTVGGINDYLYCVSYFLMATALINIGTVFKKIAQS